MTEFWTDGQCARMVRERVNRPGSGLDERIFPGAGCTTSSGVEQPSDDVYRGNWMAIGKKMIGDGI